MKLTVTIAIVLFLSGCDQTFEELQPMGKVNIEAVHSLSSLGLQKFVMPYKAKDGDKYLMYFRGVQWIGKDWVEEKHWFYDIKYRVIEEAE